MKKSFLKGASIFLASVLTVGMCSAYSVNAKAKFSLPKKTTLSYDKKDNGGNGFYHKCDLYQGNKIALIQNPSCVMV